MASTMITNKASTSLMMVTMVFVLSLVKEKYLSQGE